MKYIEENKWMKLTEYDSFSLKETLECGQCFRFLPKAGGVYQGIAFGKFLEVRQTDQGIYFQTTKEDFLSIWKKYFDLDRNYLKIKDILSKDPIIKEAIMFCPGIRILQQDFFECLISFLASQNKKIPMIQEIIENISSAFGRSISTEISRYSFPTMEELSSATENDFRKCKAGFRAKYMVDAVSKAKGQQFCMEEMKKLSTEELRNLLMTICGVGPKIADCVMLFSLGRTEVFPADVWIKRVVSHLYFHDRELTLRELNEFAQEKFGVYAGFAQQYLFHYGRSLRIGT